VLDVLRGLEVGAGAGLGFGLALVCLAVIVGRFLVVAARRRVRREIDRALRFAAKTSTKTRS